MKDLKHLVLVISCLYVAKSVASEVKQEWTEKYIKCSNVAKEDETKTVTECPKDSKCVLKDSLVCACPENFRVNENYALNVDSTKYCIPNSTKTTSTTLPPTQPSTVTMAPSATSTTTTKAPSTSSTSSSSSSTTTTTTTTTIAPSKPEPTTKKNASPTLTSTTTTTTKAPSTTKPTPAVVMTTTLQPSKHVTASATSEEVQINPAPSSGHFWSGILIPLTIVAAFIGGVFMIRKYDLLDRAYYRIRNRSTPSQRYSEFTGHDFDDDPLLI